VRTLRIALAASLSALVSVASAAADTPAGTPDTQPYRYLAVMHGDCEQLILAGRDQTARCNDELVNVDFGDGRVAFVFTSPSERGTTVTTFLGRSSQQKGLRDYRLEVDALSTATTNGGGEPTIVDEVAVGHCKMTGDPVHERARFECTVERSAGRTTARFVSSGTPSVYAGSRADGNSILTARR
jgi:hypothetical protein